MPPKTLPEIQSRAIVAQSRLFTVESLHLKFANGAERDFERMKSSSRGAVMIIAIQNPQTLLLISEYSAGTHRYELGFPKGLIDPGETVEQAANRELMEEVGVGARKLTVIKQLSLAPGYFDAQMSLVLAQDLYEKSLPGDEPEPLEVIQWPLDKADELLHNPEFSEARSVAALMLVQKWLESNSA